MMGINVTLSPDHTPILPFSSGGRMRLLSHHAGRPLMADGKRALTYDDFWNLKTVGDVQVSPDGRRVAYVVAALVRESDEQRSSIWVADLERQSARQFTSGVKQDSQPRWSPDGAWLAFVSTREGGKPQIHVMSARGGEAK